MKTFLTVYDYGQGAVWLRIDAGQVPGSGVNSVEFSQRR